MHTLLKKVRAARRRIMAGRLLQASVKHLFFAGCFAAAVVWIARWFPSLPALKIGAVAAGVALLVAVVRVMSRPVSLRSAALVLDRSAGSEERIATALVLKDDASPAAKAVMEDAIRVAQSIDPSRVAIAPPRVVSWMALPIVAMLLGIAIPVSVATSESSVDGAFASTPLLPAPIRKERSAELHRRAFDLEKRAKDLDKPKLKDLADAMRDVAETMRRDELHKGEAMAKISTLEEKAKARKDELTKNSDIIKNMLKHRDDHGAGSPDAAAASQKAKELDEKLSRLDEKVKEALKDAAKGGSPEALKQVLKELAEGMKGLEGDQLENLQRQLDEMGRGDSTDSEAMKKLLESLDDELAEFEGDLNELEMLDDELDALQAMKGEFDENGEQCLACGGRRGRCRGSCKGGGGIGGGGGDGFGTGGGPGQGPKGSYHPEDATRPAKVGAALSAGKIISAIQFKTLPSKGELKSAYSEAHHAAESEAAEALQQQEIPPGYRLHVRDYFDAIRPDKK